MIRAETPADYAAVRKLIVEVFTEAFGAGEDEARLVEDLRQEIKAGNIALVAEMDGEVVGHIFFSPVSLQDFPEIKVCVLAPLGVARAHQRQGVGSKLVEAGLAECVKLGYQIVVVQGSLKYYPRFGFVPIGESELKTIFDSDHDMVIGLEAGVLEKVSGLVEYPELWQKLIG